MVANRAIWQANAKPQKFSIERFLIGSFSGSGF